MCEAQRWVWIVLAPFLAFAVSCSAPTSADADRFLTELDATLTEAGA